MAAASRPVCTPQPHLGPPQARTDAIISYATPLPYTRRTTPRTTSQWVGLFPRHVKHVSTILLHSNLFAPLPSIRPAQVSTLHDNTTITSLDVSGNRMGPHGSKALAELLVSRVGDTWHVARATACTR